MNFVNFLPTCEVTAFLGKTLLREDAASLRWRTTGCRSKTRSTFALFGEQIKNAAPTPAPRLAWSLLPVQFASLRNFHQRKEELKKHLALSNIIFWVSLFSLLSSSSSYFRYAICFLSFFAFMLSCTCPVGCGSVHLIKMYIFQSIVQRR